MKKIVELEFSRVSEVGGIKLKCHFEACFSIPTCNKTFLFCLHVYFSSFSSSCSIDKTHSHFSAANGVFMFSLGTAPLGIAAQKKNHLFHNGKTAFFPSATSLLTDQRVFCLRILNPAQSQQHFHSSNTNIDTHVPGREILFFVLQHTLKSYI